jgi:predicted phosphoribosyltransferase
MFSDRKEAAVKLAKALEQYRNMNVVVLGIPRGGAVTGYHVADHLNAEFSLLVSRKLGHPDNPEYAVGAIAEDGTVHLNPYALSEVSQQQIDEAVAKQKIEIQRRISILRKGKPLPVLKNRIVIIVDDGIATGATIFAAIKMCRNHKASKIVVGAPVSSISMIDKLEKEADEVVILETPDFYQAVSQVYYDFPQVPDEEALELLERWNKEKVLGPKPAIQKIIDEP